MSSATCQFMKKPTRYSSTVTQVYILFTLVYFTKQLNNSLYTCTLNTIDFILLSVEFMVKPYTCTTH
jgi:hypothetical protein